MEPSASSVNRVKLFVCVASLEKRLKKNEEQNFIEFNLLLEKPTSQFWVDREKKEINSLQTPFL